MRTCVFLSKDNQCCVECFVKLRFYFSLPKPGFGIGCMHCFCICLVGFVVTENVDRLLRFGC